MEPSFSMLKFLGELIFLIALGWLIGYVPRVDDFYKNDNDEIAMCAKVHTNRKSTNGYSIRWSSD